MLAELLSTGHDMLIRTSSALIAILATAAMAIFRTRAEKRRNLGRGRGTFTWALERTSH
jgi:hypothetical protein